jgi:hypothetical protein
MAASVDNYQGTDVFSVPVEDRTVRVAIVNVDSVAVSNHDDPAVIHGMIARSRKLASPFGGPALLREYYKQVPIASLAWGIARVDPAQSNLGGPAKTLSVLFAKPAVLVLSARFLRALHLRVEAFAGSPEDVQAVASKMTAFLAIFQTAEDSAPPQGTDPDVKEFFSSLTVETHNDRAVLMATVPPGFLRKVYAPPAENEGPALPGKGPDAKHR